MNVILISFAVFIGYWWGYKICRRDYKEALSIALKKLNNEIKMYDENGNRLKITQKGVRK